MHILVYMGGGRHIRSTQKKRQPVRLGPLRHAKYRHEDRELSPRHPSILQNIGAKETGGWPREEGRD